MTDLLEKRIMKTRAILAKTNIDTFMVQIDENRRYLSGFTGEDAQFDESAGVLFITDARIILSTDSRYALQAGIEAPHCEIACYSKSLIEELPDILNTLNTRRLSFESNRMSYSRYEEFKRQIERCRPDTDFLPSTSIIEDQRS